MFGVDVELVEFLWDLDADEFVSARRLDAHADELAAIRGPLEFFIDLALHDVFVSTQAVAILEQFLDAQLFGILDLDPDVDLFAAAVPELTGPRT